MSCHDNTFPLSLKSDQHMCDHHIVFFQVSTAFSVITSESFSEMNGYKKEVSFFQTSVS